MDIRIKIDVTSGAARRLAAVGATLLVVGAAAFANAVPVTFAPHQKLAAAQLNDNFSHLETRIAALEAGLADKADKAALPALNDWVPYPAEMTGPPNSKAPPVANQTTTAYYRRVGDSVEIRTYTIFSAPPATVFPNQNWSWNWSLPEGLSIDVARAGATSLYVVGSGLAQGVNENVVLSVFTNGPNKVSAVPNGRASFYLNDLNPFAFDKTSTIALHFSVPVAGWQATQ